MPPAGPETPFGWELEQVHAAQRAEQPNKHKPFKLQADKRPGFTQLALTGLCPAEQVMVMVMVMVMFMVRV